LHSFSFCFSLNGTLNLVLILSAGFAATLALWRERALAFYSAIFSLVFGYTLAENCVGRPDGLIIGTAFTVLLMLACAIGCSMRSVELRIPQGYFADVD